MGVKNDSTLVFNKYRVIFDPPLDGTGLKNILFFEFDYFLSKKNSKCVSDPDVVGFTSNLCGFGIAFLCNFFCVVKTQKIIISKSPCLDIIRINHDLMGVNILRNSIISILTKRFSFQNRREV
jgi:hypothetical protein